MSTTDRHIHVLTLEHWRDAYVNYMDSKSSDRQLLYGEVFKRAAAADRALEAAHSKIAAQNDEGIMLYGLEQALPVIHRRYSARDDAGNEGSEFRSFSEALLVTVEYAIEDLKAYGVQGRNRK
jgi:hypothetical protein